MMVITEYIYLQSRGYTDVHDITRDVQNKITQSNLGDGVVTIFTPSSTSAITTIEYESGCIEDIKRLFEELIPSDIDYAHNKRWGDGNGHSHLRASLLGASFSVPFKQGELILGTWQQIIFVDFDVRPRNRQIVLQIVGS